MIDKPMGLAVCNGLGTSELPPPALQPMADKRPGSPAAGTAPSCSASSSCAQAPLASASGAPTGAAPTGVDPTDLKEWPSVNTPVPGGTSAAAPAVEPLLDHPVYTKVKDLGQSSYCRMQLAKDCQGRTWAVKCIERGPLKVNDQVERRLAELWRLHHPHVIALHEVFLGPTHLCVAVEFAPHGDLAKYMRAMGTPHFEDDEARWLFQQLVFAVDYCHRMGVAGCDIRMENLLVDASGCMPILKLCIFGHSKLCRDTSRAQRLATRVSRLTFEMAPEAILSTALGLGAAGSATAALNSPADKKMQDVWACGVMLYMMLVGHNPFGTRPTSAGVRKGSPQGLQVLRRICTADYDRQAISHCSEQAKDLLARILVVDPQQRITMDGIFSHPWFVKLFEGQDAPIPFQQANEALALQPQPPGRQSEADLRQLVVEARTLPPRSDAAEEREVLML